MTALCSLPFFVHEKTQVVCTVSIMPAGLVSFGCDNPVVNLI